MPSPTAMLEWDEAKRLTNIDKHRLDFVRAGLLFDGRPVIDLPAKHQDELRFLTVAVLDDVFVTLV